MSISFWILYSDDCKTTEGKHCHFPFTYGGNVYEKCTKVESSDYWCATAPEYAFDAYGSCSTNCPTENANIGILHAIKIIESLQCRNCKIEIKIYLTYETKYQNEF